jgi:hypothetical protein
MNIHLSTKGLVNKQLNRFRRSLSTLVQSTQQRPAAAHPSYKVAETKISQLVKLVNPQFHKFSCKTKNGRKLMQSVLRIGGYAVHFAGAFVMEMLSYQSAEQG